MKILKKSVSQGVKLLALMLSLSGIFASSAFAAKAKNKKGTNTETQTAVEEKSDAKASAKPSGKIEANAKITVSPPKMQNGSKEDDWLPIFVQGQLSTDFQNNSDFSVIDRMAAEQIAGEQQVKEASASMADENANIQYAELLAADYSISVSILNKGGSYSIDCKVISVASSQPVGKAYSNANVSQAALTDGSVIHMAAYELLKGMGVAESRLADLKAQASSQNEQQAAQVAAQINLSKGIALDQSGMSVEAMSYYLKAAGEDKKLREAAQRLSVTSTKVSAGNFGVAAENKIKFRNQWVDLLKQTVKSLEKDPPFIYLYNKIEPLELTENDYKNNTQGFVLEGDLYFTDEYDIIENFKKSLSAIPESPNWGDEATKFPESVASDNSWINGGVICVTLSLRDADKKIIKSTRQYFKVSSSSLTVESHKVYFNGVPIEKIKSTDTLIASVDKVEFVPRNNNYYSYYSYFDDEKYNKSAAVLKKWDISVMTVEAAVKNANFSAVTYQTPFGQIHATSRIKSYIAKYTSLGSMIRRTRGESDNARFELQANMEINGETYRTFGADNTILVRVGSPCFLGIVVEDPSYSRGGVTVKSVVKGSPADSAGIQEGDVIVDSSKEYTVADFLTGLTSDRKDWGNSILWSDSFMPGDIVTLPVRRGNETFVASAKLISLADGLKLCREGLKGFKEAAQRRFRGLRNYQELGFEIDNAGWNYRITKVVPGSLAEKAGLEVDDIFYNQKPNWGPIGSTPDILNEAIQSLTAGDTLTLFCKRKNKKIEIPIVMEVNIPNEQIQRVVVEIIDNRAELH